jgi:hypothetical protein
MTPRRFRGLNRSLNSGSRCVSAVRRASRFDKQEVHLLLGDRPVLDAPRHHVGRRQHCHDLLALPQPKARRIPGIHHRSPTIAPPFLRRVKVVLSCST